MKEFIKSPLPFQGQKRNFVKHFKQALREMPDTATYVDLFGGSGLLSHIVKSVHPKSTVIYNDFDNYEKRIKNIPKTNKILDELRGLNLKTLRGKKIEGTEKKAVLKILKKADQQGFVDWITLSSSLKFSMNYGLKYTDFSNDTLYNTIRKTNYDLATDYLKDIQVVRMDYKELYAKYSKNQNVVFLVDPPYLSTDTATYTNNSYWKLQDYLDVIDVLKGSYFYFTSDKSHIVELMNWVENRTFNSSPFKNAICTKINANVTHTAKYTDIMYHYKI